MSRIISGTYTTGITLVAANNPVTVTNTGRVSNTTASASAITAPTGTTWILTNQGTVVEPGGGGLGISLVPVGTVTNAGVVNANSVGVSLAAGGSVTNQSGGTIAGVIGVKVSGAAITLLNAGYISGNVTSGAAISLSGGGTITNLAGGTLSGSYGVGALSVAATVINAGSIGDGLSLPTGAAIAFKHGGLLVNQSGGNILAGLQGVYFGGIAATLVNAGRISGGPSTGNGVIVAAGATITNQSGGLITGKYGVRALSVAATVVNAGTLAGAQISNSAGLALSAGGAVTNQSGGTITGLRGVVSTGATVTNAGSIAGNTTASGGAGVLLSTASVLSNQAGGTITGLFGVVAAISSTFQNAGYIGGNITSGGGVTLSAGGSVTNMSGGTIGGSYGVVAASAAATVVNAGSIGNGLSLPTGAAIALKRGGLLINQAGATILAGLQGVYIGGAAGTVVNTGRIGGGTANGNGIILTVGATVTNQSGGLVTGMYGVRALTSPSTVVNAGTLAGNLATGAGVNLSAGGAVTNQSGGVMTGLRGAQLTGGTILNAGSIAGSATASNGVGVQLASGASLVNQAGGTITGFDGILATGSETVVNAGSIGGTTAVAFAAGVTNRLIDNPGGVFSGTVNGGNTIGSAQISTLELASGASAGVISGLGSTIVNFASTTIDSGASWTLSGSNTVVSGATLMNSGTLTDSGTLANLGTIGSSLGASGTAVALGAGSNRLIDNPGAVFVGSISVAGGGIDVMELASAANPGTIAGFGSGITNFTSLVFDSGARWTVAGNDAASGLGTLGIGGFAVGDTIDLTGFVAVSKTFASNVLTLTDAGNATATLAVQGSFTSASFLLGADGSGGTDVTVVPAGPAIGGTSAGQTTSDAATIDPFTAVSITDANVSQTETVTITLTNASVATDADGTLSGTGLTKTGTGTYALTAGTPSAVTTALDALVFTPTAHQVAPGSSVTTGFSIALTDTAAQSTSDATTTVIATAANDPPAISGTASNQPVADNATVDPFSGVTVSDPDFGATETVSITLTASTVASDANGTLSGTGLTKTGAGTYALAAGSPSAVTAALRALVFTPTLHQVAPGGSVATGFSLAVNDGIIESPISDASTTVIATGSAVPPVISGATAGRTVNDNATATPFSGVTITDTNPGVQEALTITLTNASVATDADGTLSGTGLTKTGTGTYTLSAPSQTAATLALDALVFTPTAHQAAPGGSVTTGFTIAVTDTIAQTASNATTTEIATAVNDPPVVGGTAANQAVADDATVDPFSGVTISDPDFGASETVTITLTASSVASDANGTLSGTGLTKTGTGTYTLAAGTPSGVTVALRALVFTPTDHEVVVGGTVTTGMALAVTDGIVASPITDTTTSVIATAVPNPPVIAGTTGAQATSDEASVTPFASVSITDPNIAQTETVTVTVSNPANGFITNLGGGLYDAGAGVYTVSGSTSAVSLALQGLQFVPTMHQVAPGATVSTGFTLDVADTSGGTASDTSTSVVATAANDPPVISGTTAAQPATDETSVTPFLGVTIADVDFGQTETVTVTLSAPGAGVLSNLAGGSYDATAGVYTVIGTDAAVSSAVAGLVFTPTSHQVAPGSTVTTGFTIAVTDTAGATVSDSTASVVATAVNDAPIVNIGSLIAGVPNQTDSTPFSNVVVIDPDVGHIDQATVTLSNAANGTLSNLSGGSYDASTGVFTLSGSATAVTAALDALVFSPAPPGAGFVTTTTFTVAISGPGGSASNSGISVSTAQQAVPGLGGTPPSNAVVAVSQNGSALPPPAANKSNQALIADPSAATTYTLPTGYQAEFLGGSTDAALSDPSGANAVLVGNTGNDTISAAAANDTIVGGAGSNTLSLSGIDGIVYAGGNATVNASGAGGTILATGSATSISVTGANAAVLGGTGVVSGVIAGDGAIMSIGQGSANVYISGSGANVLGGTANSGSLVVTMTGGAATVGAFASNATVSASGDNAVIFGGSGTSSVSVSGANAMVVGGTGAETVDASGNTQVFGGTGLLNFVGAGGSASILGATGGSEQITGGSGGLLFSAGTGNSSSITGGSSEATVFGGAASQVNLSGGDPGILVAGSGNETLNAAASSGDVVLSGGAAPGSNVALSGGSGNNTLFAGIGSDTMTGGSGNAKFAFFAAATGGGLDIVTDFKTSDSVFLVGYSATQSAVTVLDASSVSTAGVTLTLSDNTTITFSNLNNVSELFGHVLYGPGTG